jgi:predicted permease
MSSPHWLKTLLRAVRRRRFEQDLDQELRFHLDMEIEALVARGHSPEEARRIAERNFGGVERHKDSVRDVRGLTLLDDVARDVRFGIRTLRRNPAFVGVALLCLGLGIGANAAVFSVIDAVLLRPLPYGQPDRLVRLFETLPARGPGWRGAVSFPNYEDWAEQARSLQPLTAFQVGSSNLVGADGAERIHTVSASASFFTTLGVRPMLGRGFAAGEDRPGSNRVVVIGESLWRRRFGGDPGVLGRSITIDGQPHEVIGVMSGLFTFPGRATADAFLPLDIRPELRTDRGTHFLGVIGRLGPGLNVERASADLSAIARRLEQEHSEVQVGRSAVARPLIDTVVSDVRPTLLVLLGAVALVLLISCANVANLLLARSTARQPEVTLRHALGASRARLVGQLLVESAVLALAGAAVGLVLAWVGLKALTGGLSTGLPAAGSIGLDGRVLLFTLGLSMVTALLFGLTPALQSTSGNVHARMSEGEHGSSGGSHRLRSALVVAEVALSLVLLVGAGLLVRSFHALLHTDPGLRSEGLLTAHLAIPQGKFGKLELAPRLLHPALESLRALPGVDSAGLISMLPIQQAWTNGEYAVEGEPIPDPRLAPAAEMRVSSPGTFASLGVPIIEGRELRDRDGLSKEKPIVVNRALVHRHFKDGRAVGHRLIIDKTPYTIVGVVGDVRQAGLDQPPLAEIHFPYDDPENAAWLNDITLVLRTRTDPTGLAGPVRETLRGLASDQPVYDVLTMDEVISRSVANRRLSLVLLSVFAAIALVLSASGLAGVIAYLVAQRTQEIGIRMALGSEPADVVRLMVRQGGRLVIVGLVLGVVGAVLVGKYLARVLAGIQAPDPLIVVVLAAVLGGIALLATYLPARRAARVDPLIAIRAE